MNQNQSMADQFPAQMPPQHQKREPGTDGPMQPQPVYENESYKAAGKLSGKVAVITGGDSGIGKAVALAYAKEGADVAVIYLNEHEDARDTQQRVQAKGKKCLLIAGDVGDEAFCWKAVEQIIQELGGIHILVNNAAEQHPQNSIEDINHEQLEKTFRTNIFSMFYLVKAALPHMKENTCIINTTSITAYAGHETLIDYSATKGAVVTFTRSLSLSLQNRKIRVNAVAPGPIWTPLIPSTFGASEVGQFGQNTPMARPGQPVELAPAYVFLASEDSTYISGQVIHVNGGKVVNG